MSYTLNKKLCRGTKSDSLKFKLYSEIIIEVFESYSNQKLMQNYKVMCCCVIGLTITAGRWSG